MPGAHYDWVPIDKLDELIKMQQALNMRIETL
jgi:hypothetical protein